MSNTALPRTVRAIIALRLRLLAQLSGSVDFAVGGGLLLHDFHENSLADRRAWQDAFYSANQVPLSQRAGD